MTDDDYFRNAIEKADKEAAFGSIAMLGVIGFIIITIGIIALL